MQVFNYGSINLDLVYRVPHLVRPGETLASQSLSTVLGGKGANQSMALARAGVAVRHLGRIGQADSWACDELAAAGVQTAGVEHIDASSGHAIIQVDDSGENSIILHGGANQSFDRASLELSLQSAEPGDWLLLQNECNAIDDVFELAISRQLSIAFNPAPMTTAVQNLPLERCEILIVNETEALALAGIESTDADNADKIADEAMKHLAGRFPDTRLVLTLGARGARMHYQGHHWQENAVAVNVVDTTGAGDTFVGYFLAGIIQSLDEPTALRRACHAAALSVTVAGATPSIPSALAVDTALESS